jgi:hypothetical protein
MEYAENIFIQMRLHFNNCYTKIQFNVYFFAFGLQSLLIWVHIIS